MTDSYLTSITPDSLTGLLMAFDGTTKTSVILNGPTGCKFYHSVISDEQGQRGRDFDPMRYPLNFYFGQPQIPCTYLDKRDYIYGSREKLTKLLTFVRDQERPDLVAVVNSPGASLIGDNLNQIVTSVLGAIPAIIVETPGFSKTVYDGADRGFRLLAEKLAHPGPKMKKTVNILGLCIHQKHYLGDLTECRRLLELCGIKVTCALGCHCTLEEIAALPQAELNLLIYPEYGINTAKFLESKFGTPYLSLLPLGFDATEDWLRRVCAYLGCDPSPALLESERARARSYLCISRLSSMCGLPKGTRFAISGTCSQCLSFSKVMIQYFGMQADAISPLNSPESNQEDWNALAALLQKYGMEEALHRSINNTDATLVLADANILGRLKVQGCIFTGVEIALPSFGYIDVIPKTHLGICGSLFLCEQVLNSMTY